MGLYYVIRFFAKIYYALIFRVEVIGKENVPTEGSAVLCSNHISNFDAFTVAIYLNRLPRFIAKKELFRNRILAKLLFHLEAFPVDRQAAMDMKAFKTAIKVLNEGELLGIFAEGTRVKEGEAKAAKAGVAMFGLKGNAPVIPIAISGQYKFRKKVRIQFGEPITLEEYRNTRVTTEVLEEITNVIMGRVEEMKEKYV